MLTGRRFMLMSPTVAVDVRRDILILPVGSILTVTSGTSAEKGMIEVTWGDRKLAMFGSDLTERGEENFQNFYPPPGFQIHKKFANYCRTILTPPSSAELQHPSASLK